MSLSGLVEVPRLRLKRSSAVGSPRVRTPAALVLVAKRSHLRLPSRNDLLDIPLRVDPLLTALVPSYYFWFK